MYTKQKPTFCELLLSPPTRGVWIEITVCRMSTPMYPVTPHAGGVD